MDQGFYINWQIAFLRKKGKRVRVHDTSTISIDGRPLGKLLNLENALDAEVEQYPDWPEVEAFWREYSTAQGVLDGGADTCAACRQRVVADTSRDAKITGPLTWNPVWCPQCGRRSWRCPDFY